MDRARPTVDPSLEGTIETQGPRKGQSFLMSESPSSHSHRFRVQLIDLAAIVVGYGMAAVLFRAFWPKGDVSSAIGAFAIGFYVWLGLAMSGPFLLLRGSRQERHVDRHNVSSPSTEMNSRTWAEMAWLVIGVYWLIMGILVVPLRLHYFKVGDTLLFGLAPLAAGLVFRLFGSSVFPKGPAAAWTHPAAVALLLTWPAAWICLIVLGLVVL